MGSYRSGNWGFGDFILKHRRSIGVLLLLITAFMAWNAAHVRAATRFESLFPSGHPNVKLYQQYERRYGGAQTLVLLMRVRRGDVFNRDTLRKIVEVQNAVNGLPAVDHNEVFSLASYRVAFTEAVPGGLASKSSCIRSRRRRSRAGRAEAQCPRASRSRSGLDHLRRQGRAGTGGFNADRIDYKRLFDDIQAIVHSYSDSNTEIYVAGQPVIVGWGYYYLATSRSFF